MPLQANLFIERGFEVLAMFAAHAMFHVALREAGSGGDAFGELFGFSFQLIGGNHAADDSQAQGVVRRKHLAGIKQFRGARGAHDPRQEICAAEIGEQADLREGFRETRLIGSDANIGCEGQVHASAGRRAIHRSDHDFRHGGDGDGDFFAGRHQSFHFVSGFALARIAQHFQIAAGAEGAACSGQDDAVDGPVRLRAQQCVHQFLAQLQIQRVQFFRAVQTDDGDCAGAFFEYERSGGAVVSWFPYFVGLPSPLEPSAARQVS